MAQEVRRGSQSGAGALAHRRSASDLPLSPEDFFRMSPFQLMRHFSDEMDRMWSGGYGRNREQREEWRPVVDVREHNGQLQVKADLPGIEEKDVKVNVENDMLVIQGERKREEEREDEGWYRAERSYGSFYRAIPLPQGAEADKANARFNNGVLEVTIPIPKSQQQQTRQIPISAGSQDKVSKAGGA